MKDYVSGLLFVVVTVVLLLTAVWYYFFSRVVETTQQAADTMSSDAIRIQIVNDLATKLSFIVSKETELAFPTEWQQLGTASSECEISTVHCQITQSNCYNLDKNSRGKFSMPIDATYGSEDRSGLAIKQEGNQLLIRACYAETETPITQKINLP